MWKRQVGAFSFQPGEGLVGIMFLWLRTFVWSSSVCSVLGWAVYFCLLSIHINWLAPEEAPAQPSPLTAVQYCIGIVCYWPGPSTSNTVRYHSPASDVQHCGATKCLYPIIEYKISEWPSLVRSMVSKWSADKILVPGPRSVFLILCFSSHINIDIFSWILLSSGFRYSYLYISDFSCPPV